MAIVQLNIDDDTKLRATSVYQKLGIDLPSAIRIFLKRSILVNGIPFSMVLEEEDYNPTDAIATMKKMNESAKLAGIGDMTPDEINAEIASYRQERAKWQ